MSGAGRERAAPAADRGCAEPATDRPRTIRVGVTGHRAFADPEVVARRVRDGLRRVLALAGDGGDGADARIQVISALAEGADRLVAREALDLPGATLSVVLPFLVDDYAQDFQTPASRREFAGLLGKAEGVEVMPPAATREAGYEAQGRRIAEACDVLVALWDGRESRGQGGTAEIVAYAAARGTLLLWVKVDRP